MIKQYTSRHIKKKLGLTKEQLYQYRQRNKIKKRNVYIYTDKDFEKLKKQINNNRGNYKLTKETP